MGQFQLLGFSSLLVVELEEFVDAIDFFVEEGADVVAFDQVALVGRLLIGNVLLPHHHLGPTEAGGRLRNVRAPLSRQIPPSRALQGTVHRFLQIDLAQLDLLVELVGEDDGVVLAAGDALPGIAILQHLSYFLEQVAVEVFVLELADFV